jgi:hypothetical protein
VFETKLNISARSQYVPDRPLLAPIYRCPGLEEMIEFYIDSPYMAVYISVSLFDYNTFRLLSWAYVSMGLYPNTPQGYQRYGPR